MTAQAVPAAATLYLEEVERRLQLSVSRYPGRVNEVGTAALDAGGKRLRPLLVFLSSGYDERAVTAGVAVELVHTATLVHDDMIDGAELRRGHPTAWHLYGDTSALAGGDYLLTRGFAELAEAGDLDGVRILADACLAIGRGEAMQRRQLHDPSTPLEDYFERISLKTGKLLEAACLLGSREPRLGAFGAALGIAFQIVDDILDCAGDTTETGKVPGTDLREGTPTLPLILAARDDPVVRRALEGGPLEGVLVRIAATGALERSREVALDYARRARGFLRDESALEALTHMVIDRDR
jgi:octaprenyl-diphosphate synthase